MKFVKSTYSGGAGDCVEVGRDDMNDRILVRDSKAGGNGAVLWFTHSEWDAFIRGAQNYEFDRYNLPVDGEFSAGSEVKPTASV